MFQTPTGRTVYGAEQDAAAATPGDLAAASPFHKPEAIVHAMKVRYDADGPLCF